MFEKILKIMQENSRKILKKLEARMFEEVRKIVRIFYGNYELILKRLREISIWFYKNFMRIIKEFWKKTGDFG